ncbi:hypothetical protein GCM10010302_06350 [Streptomyces polychromogenes]|uniref:Uncharacterized protein n=1 Tax=Streptomyces polychromogenes TaxID=67342 RepID=A0ABN0V236_9ACTN
MGRSEGAAVPAGLPADEHPSGRGAVDAAVPEAEEAVFGVDSVGCQGVAEVASGDAESAAGHGDQGAIYGGGHDAAAGTHRGVTALRQQPVGGRVAGDLAAGHVDRRGAAGEESVLSPGHQQPAARRLNPDLARIRRYRDVDFPQRLDGFSLRVCREDREADDLGTLVQLVLAEQAVGVGHDVPAAVDLHARHVRDLRDPAGGSLGAGRGGRGLPRGGAPGQLAVGGASG